MPDGKSLIVEQSNASGMYLPMLMPVAPIGPPKALISETTNSLSVSPDSQWIAYVSDERGSRQVYVIRADGGGVPERVSTGTGEAVAWSRDRNELFYLRESEILAVSFRNDAGRFRVTGERVWSRVNGNYTDKVLAQGLDGRLLVAFSKDRSPRQIRVVVNWAPEVASTLK